jgi:trigger factor
MSVKVENIEKGIVKLEIEVSAEKFEEGMQKSFKKNQNKYAIPGFRKGKAPRNIIERYYGEGILFEDAVGFTYPDAYDAAVKEQGLEPVSYPEIDVVQIGKGKTFIFSAKVTLKPEVEISGYKNIEIAKVVESVTDEQVDAEIEKERSNNARITKVEDRATQNGDVCVIDFEGFVDDIAFEGGKGNDYPLTLGSNTFIPGFEEQLIGKEIGQDIDVTVTFPVEYHKEDLAGKEAVFKVSIKEIKEKILPELNDDFAKDISEFDTFVEYKNSVKEKINKKADEKSKTEMENALITKLIEMSEIEVPQVMIENRVDQMVQDFDRNLRYQGLDLRRYIEMSGGDYLGFRKRFEERAEKDVRTVLIIEKISKLENIIVTEEEVENNINEMVQKSGETYENVIKYLGEEGKESIKENLVFKKTIDFLIDNANLV